MTEELSSAERVALAARGWYERQRQRGERLDPISHLLYQQLGEIYYDMRGVDDSADEPMWVARTLVDVRKGDTIRMPAQPETQTVVEGVSPVLPWHVGPNADERHPERSRLEWTELKVKFTHLAEPISFRNPAMPIEIQVTPSELAAIEAAGGWSARITPAWVHFHHPGLTKLECCDLPAMRSHLTTTDPSEVTCPGVPRGA